MQFEDLENVYLENAKIVHNYLMCMAHDKNTAEELTQETFFQASKTMSKFRGECKVSVWLCQIAKNLWYKHQRQKNQMILPISELYDIASSQDLEAEYNFKESRRELYHAIHQLNPKIRELVYLRLGNFSFKEIGEIMGQSENWCRVNYHRAKLRIKELVKG